MLSAKQNELFKLLGIPPDNESEIRKRYALSKEGSLTRKPFTGWLEDCLKAKWRRENSRVYVGD